jgi:hypothetical protein
MATRKSLMALPAGLLLALLMTGTSADSPAAASAATKIHSVDWENTAVPGAVCDAPHKIRLHNGSATIITPPGLVATTSRVVVREATVAYGDVQGNRDDTAAVNVSCASTGGTADAEITDSWVIYRARGHSLRTLGILTSRQPEATGIPHVPYFDVGPGGIILRPGRITVREVWYDPNDATCCPSRAATTVWTVGRHGALTPRSTTASTRSGTAHRAGA